jgi:DNA primase
MEPAFSGLKDGRQIRIMLLPQNHDPDSMIREEGIGRFTDRVQDAETLSEYFFGHISNELNLSEMEGRAQLANKAKPYLEKLPESIFKEMMFTRLKELSGWGSLDVLENATTLASKQSLNHYRKRPQDNGRLSSARVAIALLVQNPRLAEQLERQEIDWSGLEFPGATLFKNILQMIAEKRPSNVAVLLESYRDAAEEKPVKALAFLDLQVSDDNIDTVFNDALNSLLKQARDACLARLLDKDKAKGLDAQEKVLLRKMLTEK